MFDARQPEKVGILPVGTVGFLNSGWWGVWTVIATEAALFGYLLFSYLYLAVTDRAHWPPEGPPTLQTGLIGTAVLLGSSVVVWGAERLLAKNRRGAALAAMALAIVMGVVFVVLQLQEWRHHTYGPSTHLYGALYFTITGFHLAHVAVGLVVLTMLALWMLLGHLDAQRRAPLTIGNTYWHFVDAVWLFVFATLYLSPYLL